MHPIDRVYGPRAYCAYHEKYEGFRNLTPYQQKSTELFDYEPLIANNYEELLEIISFLTVMNKRTSVYFRGQSRHLRPLPSIFRPRWRSLSGESHNIPRRPEVIFRIFEYLNNRIAEVVLTVCRGFSMPRRRTLEMFKEASWAVAQHYELWPTPLIDITSNLRIAVSFALYGESNEGHLYVVAMPPSINSITFEADQHIVLARLQAACPPIAKRPHYQDGFLVGRFPFIGPNSNQVDSDPCDVSDLSRRLIAHIILKNAPTRRFWNKDFPPISGEALLPKITDDALLEEFTKFMPEIDDAMHRICGRS